ncbi:zinc-binding dehydrogenase [Paenibacillus durus]|uniref:zinc-binding dehydrogenase n=1 Tax=Paenibacillus durus TaxID=44251 RepID=UPI0009DCCFC1
MLSKQVNLGAASGRSGQHGRRSFGLSSGRIRNHSRNSKESAPASHQRRERDMFETMNRAIEHNGLRPVVDRMFPFERAVEALQYLAEGSYFGKICIKF